MSRTAEEMCFDSLQGRKRSPKHPYWIWCPHIWFPHIWCPHIWCPHSVMRFAYRHWFPKDKLVQTINLHRIEVALKHLETTMKNQNCIQEENKSSLTSGNAFCLPVHHLLSSCLLSKNVKIKNIQNYNFACCSVWMWNLVSDTEGRTYAEGVPEYDAEEGTLA